MSEDKRGMQTECVKMLTVINGDITQLKDTVTVLEEKMEELSVVSRHIAIFKTLVQNHFDDRAIRRREEEIKDLAERNAFKRKTEAANRYTKIVATIAVVLTAISILVNFLVRI